MFKNKVIRRTAFIMAFLTVFISLGISANAIEYPKVEHAKYAYVMNIENGQVLMSKNEKHKIYPASTVKIMTAILSIEALGDTMKKKIAVPDEAIKLTSGNNIGLKAGEVLTVEQLLSALIIGGANDAAYTLAITIAGSVDSFVEMMNKKAAEIGASDTVYMNPTGVHDDAMFTTVSDVAKIAMYAYGINTFMEMAREPYFAMDPTNLTAKNRRIVNKNYMVSSVITSDYYNLEILGINAGYTPSAGYCAVEIQAKEGLAYMCIIMGANYDSENDINYSYVEAQELLDWAFLNFNYVEVISSTDMICEIPVRLSSNSDHVVLLPEKNIEVYLPSDIDIEHEIERKWVLFDDMLEAPVEMGQIAGELSLFYAGKNIGTVNLVAKNNVDRSQWVYISDNMVKFFSTRWFRGFIVTFILVSAVFVLIISVVRQRNLDKRRKLKRSKRK